MSKLRDKFLRTLGRLLKTDAHYLIGSGSWLIFEKIASSAASILLTLGFANLLSQTNYGIYQFVFSLVPIIGMFTLTGMGTAITQSTAQGFDGALKRGVVLHLKWSIGVALAALAGASYYFINENVTLGTSLLIVGAFSPFLHSFSHYTSYLKGKKEFKTLAILSVLRKIIVVTSLLIALFLTGNPVVLVGVYFVAHTINALLFYYITLKIYQPEDRHDPDMPLYGKHLSAINIIGTIAGNIDKILIFHYLGAAQLAIFTIAALIPKELRQLNRILQVLTLPKYSARSIESIKNAILQKVLWVLVFFTLLFVMYVLLAPALFDILLPQYTEAILYSQVFALILLTTPEMLPKQVFIAHRKKKDLYTFSIVPPIVKIALVVVLIPLYGIWGAIAATLSTRVVSILLTTYLFRRI